VTKETLAES
jgi:hypothetical protein